MRFDGKNHSLLYFRHADFWRQNHYPDDYDHVQRVWGFCLIKNPHRAGRRLPRRGRCFCLRHSKKEFFMTDVYLGANDPQYTDENFAHALELSEQGKTNGWCPNCKRYYEIVDAHTGDTRYYATPQNEAQKFHRVSCIPCIAKQYPL